MISALVVPPIIIIRDLFWLFVCLFILYIWAPYYFTLPMMIIFILFFFGHNNFVVINFVFSNDKAL